MIPRHLGFWFLFLAIFTAPWTAVAEGADVYDEKADAHHDLAAALATAPASHKNIVLVFGANWCADCRALDAQMHNPELASMIEQNFVLVKINVGRFDKNSDVCEQYAVPIKNGIPTVAVLDPHGKLLYAMDQGQFADARHMSYESIKAFFDKWKPGRSGNK